MGRWLQAMVRPTRLLNGVELNVTKLREEIMKLGHQFGPPKEIKETNMLGKVLLRRKAILNGSVIGVLRTSNLLTYFNSMRREEYHEM